MDLITPELLKKILIQSGETDNVETVLSDDSEPAVGNGENYCSNIVRIHLKLKLTSGKIFNKSLVLKVFLKNLDEVAKKEMKIFFANEATMYDKILIHLETLAKEHNLKNPRIWPECYFADTNLVIFEDLKEPGFVVAPRHNGLTLGDALQVISGLGRFHALSAVAERRKLIKPRLLRNTYPWAQPDSFIAEYVRTGISTAGDIVQQWGKEWEDVGRKIANYSNGIKKELNDLFMEDVELKVVNHGDAWINNLMVKYNEKKEIETVRFVDFQNATYNSCGWDLAYFLYSSLQGELIRNNYDKLLTSYRDEFVDTIKRLGEDPSLALSLDQIKADIVRLHPFCLTIACTVQSCVFNVSTEPIQIDELVTNELKRRALYTSDTWKSTMKVHIKYFQEQNLF